MIWALPSMRNTMNQAEKELKKLNVLYQSDDNYAMVSGISIVSLLENNRHLDEINIFYCDYNISGVNRTRLVQLVQPYRNAKLKFMDANPYHDTFMKLKVKPWHGVYITWLKMLAFNDVATTTDRVLFINGHTIINGPLDELIDLDFGNAVMALSYDCLVNDHKKSIKLKSTDGYFNCGIMLINHRKWRKENIDKYVKDQLKKKSDYQIADQDLCNVIFRNRIKTLSVTYNFSSAYYAYDLRRLLKLNQLDNEAYFYSYDELMESYYSPKIVHSLFGVHGKPWEQGTEHPQKQLWCKYLRMTPWSDVSLPIAKRTLNWRLYDMLPSAIFLQLYIYAVRRKYVHGA